MLLEMIAVAVHKDYARRGIGRELTNLLLQNSKNKGFYMSKAECSSLYSTKALTKNGAITEKTIVYEDYRVKGGCCSAATYPFQGKTDGVHTAMNLVVFRHFPENVK